MNNMKLYIYLLPLCLVALFGYTIGRADGAQAATESARARVVEEIAATCTSHQYFEAGTAVFDCEEEN